MIIKFEKKILHCAMMHIIISVISFNEWSKVCTHFLLYMFNNKKKTLGESTMYIWNSSYNTERHLLQQRFLHKVNGVLPTRNRININSLSSFPRDTTKLILYINMYPGLYFHTFLADTWSVKKEKNPAWPLELAGGILFHFTPT